jgi:hypothetical protein
MAIHAHFAVAEGIVPADVFPGQRALVGQETTPCSGRWRQAGGAEHAGVQVSLVSGVVPLQFAIQGAAVVIIVNLHLQT